MDLYELLMSGADRTKPAPRLAVNIPARCPVRRECRDAGELEPNGVWAGGSAWERKQHPAEWTGPA